MALTWKNKAILTSFHIFQSPGKRQNVFRYLSYFHKYAYLAHLFDYFALSFLQKLRIYRASVLFGTIPSVGSYSRHFGQIKA